jgi:selenocysteine lyase/cysteine desulfurase
LQTPESEKCRSGIVNFKVENPQQVVKMLGDEGIVISARANGLRVSPHFYNTEEEISKLMEEIKHSS